MCSFEKENKHKNLFDIIRAAFPASLLRFAIFFLQYFENIIGLFDTYDRRNMRA